MECRSEPLILQKNINAKLKLHFFLIRPEIFWGPQFSYVFFASLKKKVDISKNINNIPLCCPDSHSRH